MTALAVIAVAILIVVFIPLSAAFVAALAGIIGLALLISDVVCMICNDGKDIATTLRENGHPLLADILQGFQWGCDIVEFVIPLGAAVKTMSRVGAKTFLKTSWSTIKNQPKMHMKLYLKVVLKMVLRFSVEYSVKVLYLIGTI